MNWIHIVGSILTPFGFIFGLSLADRWHKRRNRHRADKT